MLFNIQSAVKIHCRCLKQIFTSSVIRHYTARRAILYVPGDQQNKLTKAGTLKVDCIAMDCEDGVAMNKKVEARRNIQEILNKGAFSTYQPEWSVRVNSIDSGICGDDLEAVLTANNLPPTLLLPKVDHPEHIEWFSEKVKKYLMGRGDFKTKLNLIIYIESAMAIMNLPAICNTAKKLATSTPLEPVALILGSDDLCASLGVVRSKDAMELLYCRQKFIVIAKVFDLQAIDMVYIQFNDTKGLLEQCDSGKKMGFTGKQVIHPNQIPIVQQAFSPSKEAIAWAEGLVSGFYEHQNRGQGVFVYHGSMIDKPSLRQAENILELAKVSQNQELSNNKR